MSLLFAYIRRITRAFENFEFATRVSIPLEPTAAGSATA